MNSAHLEELSPITQALLARFEGLPAILSVTQAAALIGVKPKSAYQQISRGKGIFAKLVREVDGGEKFICLGDVANLMAGQLPQDEKKRKAGRPSNAYKAEAAYHG